MVSSVISLLSETVQLIHKFAPKIVSCRPRNLTLPGPKGLPVLGNSHEINSSHMEKICTKWSKIHGDLFQFKFFGKSVVVISDVDLLRKAFASQTLSRHLNDRSVNATSHVFTGRRHIGLADLSDKTVSLRKILRKNVLHYQMKEDVFQNCSRVAIENFVEKLTSKYDTNLDRLIKEYLTDLHSIMLIGETLPADDPDSQLLWELIDHLYTLLEPSIDAPLRLLPFLRFMPGKYGTIFRDTIKARDGVARRYFDTQKSTYKEGRVRGLVDVCLKIQHEEIQTKGESWLTDDYIKGLMYDTLAAGMSEMMKSIRMLILLMCHYQNVQSRVHAEIDDVIGATTIPCSSHRNKMPYTEAVIFEMLRYVSQTPLAIPHKSNKDVILDGYLIEKDSGIFPNIWGIHHDETVWGDPWVFRPERFLTENGELLPEDHKLRKTLIPFSVGKRRCPGEDFALSRLFLLFTSMLQRIEFTPPDGEELPSADPRLYTNKYPLQLPVFKCRALPREAI